MPAACAFDLDHVVTADDASDDRGDLAAGSGAGANSADEGGIVQYSAMTLDLHLAPPFSFTYDKVKANFISIWKCANA